MLSKTLIRALLDSRSDAEVVSWLRAWLKAGRDRKTTMEIRLLQEGRR